MNNAKPEALRGYTRHVIPTCIWVTSTLSHYASESDAVEAGRETPGCMNEFVTFANTASKGATLLMDILWSSHVAMCPSSHMSGGARSEAKLPVGWYGLLWSWHVFESTQLHRQEKTRRSQYCRTQHLPRQYKTMATPNKTCLSAQSTWAAFAAWCCDSQHVLPHWNMSQTCHVFAQLWENSTDNLSRQIQRWCRPNDRTWDFIYSRVGPCFCEKTFDRGSQNASRRCMSLHWWNHIDTACVGMDLTPWDVEGCQEELGLQGPIIGRCWKVWHRFHETHLAVETTLCLQVLWPETWFNQSYALFSLLCSWCERQTWCCEVSKIRNAHHAHATPVVFMIHWDPQAYRKPGAILAGCSMISPNFWPSDRFANLMCHQLDKNVEVARRVVPIHLHWSLRRSW